MCRTKVSRSPCKRVSHPSSMSSVKGNLGGQAWLTLVPCLVRRGPEECNTARSARRASTVNMGPMSCEASQPRCCGYSLRANIHWWFGINSLVSLLLSCTYFKHYFRLPLNVICLFAKYLRVPFFIH